MSTWEDFKRTHPKFSNVSIDAVKTFASTLRDGVDCNVSDEFGSGIDNVAFKVLFTDGIEWICRIHGEDKGDTKAYTASKIASTVATMRYIKHNSSIPVPSIYAHETQNSTPGLGAGYIIMELVYGEEVDLTPNALTPDEESQVYGQLADITWKLSQLRFPKIGRIYEDSEGNFNVGPFVDQQGVSHGPFDTSVEFFKYKTEFIRSRHDKWFTSSPTATPEDYERSRAVCSLYEKVASELSDYDSGSFPLSHGDLGTHNLLFSYNAAGQLFLNGVIDWDAAHTSSWVDFGQYPTMLEVRWPTLEAGRYALFVLESIYRKQRAFLQGISDCEREYGNDCLNYPQLSKLIDCPAVRVAEFILLYSDPEFNVDCKLLLKYVRAWKKNWN
jgi:aminoglycoside phosphotransferase (APT) family kinase protein